jgi:hypothetical protein
MSLFGSSPDESAAAAASSKSRISLFDDEPIPAPASKSSLFAEDDVPGASPWGMPTPKKAARRELVKSLLPANEIPDAYTDIYNVVLREGDNVGGKISVAGVAKVLSAGNLGTDDQSRILNVVLGGEQVSDLSRNEFNVLLALIGLAQEHEDVTLDGVDERRRSTCSTTSRSASANVWTSTDFLSSTCAKASKFNNKDNCQQCRVGCNTFPAACNPTTCFDCGVCSRSETTKYAKRLPCISRCRSMGKSSNASWP